MAGLGLLSYVATNEELSIKVEKIGNISLYTTDKEVLTIDMNNNGNELFCTKDRETQLGICKQYFNGIEKVSYTHENSIKNGAYIELYDEVDIPKAILEFENGINNGLARHYNEKGNLIVECNFINGRMHDQCLVFSPEGFKTKEIYYNHGNMYLIKEFYPDGYVKSIYDVKDKKIHGTYKELYTNGLIKVLVPYVNGKCHGLEKSFNEEGTLISDINYCEGIRHGSCTYYNSNGDIIDIYLYEEGNPVNF
jgi:antitoxin component YwqK of YwqJK toxin-antitoxin module